MRRCADDLARPEQLSHRRYRHGCLTHLNAVRVRRQSDIDSIIDEKSGAVRLTEFARSFREQEQVSGGQIFFSQLDGFDSAVECLFQNVEEIPPSCLATVGYQVKSE